MVDVEKKLFEDVLKQTVFFFRKRKRQWALPFGT